MARNFPPLDPGILNKIKAAGAGSSLFKALTVQYLGAFLPGQAEELIAQRLRDTPSLLDVRVLDHLIIEEGHEFSFAETGRL